MSTILADTIRKTGGTLGVDIRVKSNSLCESEGGTSVTTSISLGLAKVGIYYDLTNNTNQQSWNVSSVTDHGTGNQQIFYTNNVTGNAISVYMASNGTHGDGEIFGSGSNSHYQRIRNTSGSLIDSTQTCSSVHGDLA